MQITHQTNAPRSTQVVAFLLYLAGGLSIFLFGANTFKMYPTNKNYLYEWGLTALLLLLAILSMRVPRWRGYSKIISAMFLASAANAINLAMGNFLGEILHLGSSGMRALAFDKLSQAIPIVLTIILLSLWCGDDLGSLFLKRGDLKGGLKFGLISFAVFALIFAVIVALQANAPRSQGLFATGVSVSAIVSAIPWILVFCFVNSFMEELWFRGVSLGRLASVAGRMVAILATALVFGVSHLAGTYITPSQMALFSVIVVSLGLVNAHVMLKTGSIWGSVFFHAGYDLLVIIPIMVSA